MVTKCLNTRFPPNLQFARQKNILKCVCVGFLRRFYHQILSTYPSKSERWAKPKKKFHKYLRNTKQTKPLMFYRYKAIVYQIHLHRKITERLLLARWHETATYKATPINLLNEEFSQRCKFTCHMCMFVCINIITEQAFLLFFGFTLYPAYSTGQTKETAEPSVKTLFIIVCFH